GLVRSFANIADELEAAGYSEPDVTNIKQALKRYLNVREIIRKASGESLDLKPYEADMRHLIDTYIEADEPRKISPFENMSLLDLIVKTGIADAIATRLNTFKGNKEAVAETIEKQRPQQNHQRAPQRPGFLRKNVSLAGRDHRTEEGESR